MAKTIVRELGGNKNTVVNKKIVVNSPTGDRVQIFPGTVPKTKY